MNKFYQQLQWNFGSPIITKPFAVESKLKNRFKMQLMKIMYIKKSSSKSKQSFSRFDKKILLSILIYHFRINIYINFNYNICISRYFVFQDIVNIMDIDPKKKEKDFLKERKKGYKENGVKTNK